MITIVFRAQLAQETHILLRKPEHLEKLELTSDNSSFRKTRFIVGKCDFF